MLPNIEIIVGTYSDFLLGYRVTKQRVNGVDNVQVKQTFADKSHAGSLKCVAAEGPWIASGGSDDRIFIYDMRIRKQSQILNSHTGTVNGLVFSPDLTHLLSVSSDGHLLVTRVGSWTIEGDFKKAHGGNPVTQIACHPTSRLALSIGSDLVLNTWNLMKGRIAYRTNLKSKRTYGGQPECLAWSPDGSFFSMCGPQFVEIWNLEKARIERTFQIPSKPICATWFSERGVVVGLESGSLAWVSLDDGPNQDTTLISVHNTRVKGIACMDEFLVTISSAGEIGIWTGDFREKTLTQLASAKTDCRPTCLALLDLNQCGYTKKEKDEEDDDESGDQDKEDAVDPDNKNDGDQEEHDDGDQEEDEEQNGELGLIRPRSFVSIEYDIDAEGDNNQPRTKISNDSEESDAESENSSDGSDDESDGDTDDGSSSSSEDERRPYAGKGNKRKGNVDHKKRAKR